jgi:hypothetical protein
MIKIKRKYIVVVCMLLIVTSRSYGQDSLYQSKLQGIAKELTENSRRFTSYKKLPEFIRHYLDEKNDEKFRISRIFFNASDVGFGYSRKLYYIVKSSNNYILAYEHGGRGNHFHTIIFETNGKEIIHVYNLNTAEHKHVTDLLRYIELRSYDVMDGSRMHV